MPGRTGISEQIKITDLRKSVAIYIRAKRVWTRTYKRHVAAQHVKYLRQFIKQLQFA